MDILFIGGIFDEKEIRKKSKGGIQSAANTLQWNIIKGLDECINKPVTILNAVFVGSYPKKYKDMIIQSSKWKHIAGANDINVGFINIDGIKHFSRARRMASSIEEWAREEKAHEPKFIVAYSMHMPFLYAIKRAKEINPNIKVCLIVPDLPQYMKLSKDKSQIYSILKSIDYKLIRSMLNYIDTYVLLTKHMSDYLGIAKDKYIVIEGIVNRNDITIKVDESRVEHLSEEKTILYTGTLNWKYGIGTLLEAFEHIENKNYRLQICGSGEAEEEIKKLSQLDKRIKFFGSVNRDEVLKLQGEATVLINPRNSEGEFTKYSFPSKNMEYLLSGRPTIAYHLPGIPEEYKEFMYFVEENSSESMAEKILEICKKDPSELKDFGKKAQRFVIEEKNNIKQAKRIIEMLMRINPHNTKESYRGY